MMPLEDFTNVTDGEDHEDEDKDEDFLGHKSMYGT